MAIIAKTSKKTGKRFYDVGDGKSYPSVTTILQVISKPALINWAANMERKLVIESSANLYLDLPLNGDKMSKTAYITSLTDRLGKTKAHQRELSKAGEIGSQVHALIEWNIRKGLGQEVGEEPKLVDKALWAFMVWQDWAEKVKFEPVFCEQTVFSDKYQYAGTMDLLANICPEGTDEKIQVVVDWKTGKAIYDEALLQNVAYVKALIEMKQAEPPIHGLIVRLPKNEKDPEPETRLIHHSEHDKLFESFLHARALWNWQNKTD